jgi:fimbrial chaperone protein
MPALLIRVGMTRLRKNVMSAGKKIASLLIAMSSWGAAQDAQQFRGDEAPLPFDAVPVDAVTPFGGMSFSPTHITLEEVDPSGQMNIYNTGDKPIRLRIDAIDMAVDSNRNYAAVEEGDRPAWSALPFFRYAPRQSTLAPGERQLVRIVAFNNDSGQPAEYRSHLAISVEPIGPVADELVNVADKLVNAANPDAPVHTFTASTELRYRVIAPVIYRSGEAESVTRVKAARRDANNPSKLLITLEREGPHGEYGFVRALSAKGVVIAEASGISVLVPNDTRELTLSLPDGAPPVARVVFAKQVGSREAGAEISSLALN